MKKVSMGGGAGRKKQNIPKHKTKTSYNFNDHIF